MGHYSWCSGRCQPVFEFGSFFTADYLDTYSFTFVYDKSKVDFKLGINSIEQNSFYLCGRKVFRPDILSGLLTLSLDGFYIDNDDLTKMSDEAKIYGTYLSYLAYTKKYYVDLGFAQSNYYDDLVIEQWNPTIGLGFNKQRNWLQVRGYYITSSEKTRTQGEKTSKAIEMSLSHYFDGHILNLNKIKAGLLIGERIFAVDRDAASVYNLSDIQKGSFSLLAEFKIISSVKLIISGGKERYTNKIINDDYSSRYLYMGLSSSW